MISIKRIVASFMAVAFVVSSQSYVKAANKPTSPDKVTVLTQTCEKYWQKHEKELTKKGKYAAEWTDADISWDTVSGVDGYRVEVIWDVMWGDHLEKSIVDVKKEGKKYTYVAKTYKKDGRGLAKNAKDYIYNEADRTIKNSKLSFLMDGHSSEVTIKKVNVKSYKLVKDKRVYSKYTTAYPKK